MRRFYFVAALTIFLQACSGFGANVAATPTPTITFTPTISPTITETPSITPTTTIVHIPTQDLYPPTAILMPIKILVDGNTITPFAFAVATSTDTGPGPGFKSVLLSEKKIFWGSCKHNKVKITAQVENPEDVYSVIIFVRVKALQKEDYTPWTSGDVLQDHRNGTFSYTLVGSNIQGHNHYKDSWVFFQLVATDEKGAAIGRTIIYTDLISLSPCK